MARIYTGILQLFWLFAGLFARRNSKLAHWIGSRDQWRKDAENFERKGRLVWFHCASVGEFEQARPIIELLKREQGGDLQVLVTFFSASGYNVRRDYQLADVVTYLPFDLPNMVKPFIAFFRPDLVVFIKYELWFNTMDLLYQGKVPMALVSAYFQPHHWTLRWPGIYFGKRLFQFSRIFTQDENSVVLLARLGLANAVVAGDTRVDRVLANAQEPLVLNGIEQFVGNRRVLVIGSNWPEDDELLFPVLDKLDSLMVIVAPHVINQAQLDRWKEKFGQELKVFSELKGVWWEAGRILYIDQIGMLSKLYRLGTVAFVGGGFGKSVHNTLEAAVYGIPIIFGPKNKRFAEVQRLKELGAGAEVRSVDALEVAVQKALTDENYRSTVKQAMLGYFNHQKGASVMIVEWARRVLMAQAGKE